MSGIRDILTEGLNKMRDEIIRNSQDAGQEASGETYRRITVEVQDNGTVIEGYILAPSYFYTLIRGRGPGGIPANLPQILVEWARAKGISFSTPEELVRFANATAWKIKREGSELYRNHLYVDLVDTPAKDFEQWLEKQIDETVNVMIEQNFVPAEDGTHGYII